VEGMTMTRKAPSYSDQADKARRAFLRGTTHTSPHAAIQAGARTEEQWAACLDGFRARYFASNGLKARKAVRSRHPMQGSA
jgi:hypothetical protein